MNALLKVLAGFVALSPEMALSGDLFSYPVSRQALFQRQVETIEARAGAALALERAEVLRSGKVRASARSRASGNPVVAARKLQGRHIALYLADARLIAQRHRIPEALFLALIQQESAWNRDARSSAGAIGLAQLMPGTAKYLRVNPHDPVQNLEGGARYLREQFEAFGNWRLALAAYNAGPGAVQKYNGVPPYSETRKYVKRILGS